MLAAEWDAAYDEATDKLEDVLYNKAMDGDLGALVFALRSRMPHKYNPALIAKLEMLALMKAKAAAEAAPMIGGHVNGSNGMHIVPEFISILALPWNARGPSPHVPGWYDSDDDESHVIVPFPQDGSGLTMELPRGWVNVEHHSPPFEHLPAFLVGDDGPVPPAAATDLWRRIKAHNRWLAEAYPALVDEEPVGYASRYEADPAQVLQHPRDLPVAAATIRSIGKE